MAAALRTCVGIPYQTDFSGIDFGLCAKNRCRIRGIVCRDEKFHPAHRVRVQPIGRDDVFVSKSRVNAGRSQRGARNVGFVRM